jgi:hypothetical protein
MNIPDIMQQTAELDAEVLAMIEGMTIPAYVGPQLGPHGVMRLSAEAIAWYYRLDDEASDSVCAFGRAMILLGYVMAQHEAEESDLLRPFAMYMGECEA